MTCGSWRASPRTDCSAPQASPQAPPPFRNPDPCSFPITTPKKARDESLAASTGYEQVLLQMKTFFFNKKNQFFCKKKVKAFVVI